MILKSFRLHLADHTASGLKPLVPASRVRSRWRCWSAGQTFGDSGRFERANLNQIARSDAEDAPGEFIQTHVARHASIKANPGTERGRVPAEELQEIIQL